MRRSVWVLGIAMLAIVALALLRIATVPESGESGEDGAADVDGTALDTELVGPARGNDSTVGAAAQSSWPRNIGEPPLDWSPPPGTVAAWTPVDRGQAVEAFVPEHGSEVEEAVLVALPRDMWTWDVGTRLYLPVPRLGTAYPISIERVESLLEGNRTYVGKLSEDFPLSVVITVGERNVFANFSTPRGSYELAGNRDYGWLMPMENMDQHVDHSQPDYFLPGEDGLFDEELFAPADRDADQTPVVEGP